MIKGLHETHLQVRDLERSIHFYESLGLELGTKGEEAAFMMIGPKGRHQTLGLWKQSEDRPLDIRHFAFEISEQDMDHAKEWLSIRGIETRAVFGRDNSEPVVHAWAPSAAIYFFDPDGNDIEFYTYLAGTPRRTEGTLTLSEWRQLSMDSKESTNV